VIENIVALTGIEPTGRRFSSVQLGLSNCVFGLVQYATKVFRAVRMPDVLPRCCPAAGIRLLAAQSETVISRVSSLRPKVPLMANIRHPLEVGGATH
jgi:hypothetical protein